MSDNPEHSRLNNKNLKNTIFKVPEGYFDTLGDKIRQGIETEESELSNNQHLKQNIFTTPVGYFDQLSEKINKQVEDEIKVIPLYRQQWLKYAAAVVILAVAFFILPKNNPEPSEIANVSNEAIISYLEEQQAIQYELLSSIDGLGDVLDNMLTDETSAFSFAISDNPELEYDFEYFDY